MRWRGGLVLAILCATSAAWADAVVLTYHDMVPARGKGTLWFDCTPAELRSQVDWLAAKGAKFVSLAQIDGYVTRRKPLPARAVMISFADNYEGFYQYAWPILRKRGIPVTLFVHTGFVGNRQGRPKMTWSQLQELSRSGLVTVASQTVSHPDDVTRLTASQLDREMSVSLQSLRLHLGLPVYAVAYPNGKFNAKVVAAARRAGYRLGFTEEQMPISRRPSPLEIPRYVHTKYRRAWADLR